MIRTIIKYRSILALTIFFFKNKNSFYPTTRLFDRRKIQTWQTIAEFEWFQTGEWRLEKEGERSRCRRQRLFSPPRTRLVSRQRKKEEGREWRWGAKLARRGEKKMRATRCYSTNLADRSRCYAIHASRDRHHAETITSQSPSSLITIVPSDNINFVIPRVERTGGETQLHKFFPFKSNNEIRTKLSRLSSTFFILRHISHNTPGGRILESFNIRRERLKKRRSRIWTKEDTMQQPR